MFVLGILVRMSFYMIFVGVYDACRDAPRQTNPNNTLYSTGDVYQYPFPIRIGSGVG